MRLILTVELFGLRCGTACGVGYLCSSRITALNIGGEIVEGRHKRTVQIEKLEGLGF